MRDAKRQELWESLREDIKDHVEAYFRDNGTAETDAELLEFIWANRPVWEDLKRHISGSKLGDKIVKKAYDTLINETLPEYE